MEDNDPRPTETPEDSAGGDDNQPQSAGAKTAAPSSKDRKCQYCKQAFTSSSLGRHLDQFLFKKKPDGLHDVEEIRRIRSGITRRQARTSSKRDSPDREEGKGAADGEGGKLKSSSVRMMFNTPTWHATGVINDIPSPNNAQGSTTGLPARFSAKSQNKNGAVNLPDYASRGAGSNNLDTMRALELALREVLDNIKAATSSRMQPRVSPFDFDIQSQTFPSLCLQLLPPPPSLFATHPFPSPSSFPLSPPGVEHLDIVGQALRAKIEQWQSDQLCAESTNGSLSAKPDPGMITRNAQQHEDISLKHLELSFKHWSSLPMQTRQDAWQLEITRAFARELEKRKSGDEQLARVQQEANQLRIQVDRLGSCQWPREFALFPPDVLPLSRDIAKELDAKESHISPDSPRWDYDSVLAKWKRVVMHDRSMGRIGVGYSNTAVEDPSYADSTTRPRVDEPFNLDRRTLQPSAALSPDPSSSHTGGASAPSSQHPSPYDQNNETNASPSTDGPQAKRPRLNGQRRFGSVNEASEGASSPSSAQNASGPSRTSKSNHAPNHNGPSDSGPASTWNPGPGPPSSWNLSNNLSR